MDSFKQITDELGVLLADDKSIGPTNNLTFLGSDVDTVSMMVRVPKEK